jgi:DNA-binding response OmpR family regulator
MKRILIADDAFELGRLLQTVFLTIDPTLSVQVVPSAEEALLESSRKPIDLLVSDIRLPGMSGLQLVKKIRVRHAALKVIIITGLSDAKVLESVRDLNVDAFFQKPVEMAAFLAAARRCLDLPTDGPLAVIRTVIAPTSKPGQVSAAAEATLDAARSEGAPAGESAAPAHETLSGLVAGLRQRLGALAVWVLDERGRIVAQAGDVPDLLLEEHWAGAALSALAAGAKLSRLAGEGPVAQAMVYQGKDYHLVLAPAGNYALLTLLRPGRSTLRMALAVEEALENQQPLAEILAAMKPAHTPMQEAAAVAAQKSRSKTSPLSLAAQPAPVVESAPEPALHDFEALFQQKTQPAPAQDVDAFWDALNAAGQPGLSTNPDVLSYDEAHQLGLTPNEES